MRRVSLVRSPRVRLLASALSLAVLGGLLAPASVAASAIECPEEEKPEVFPVGDLEPGMMGAGYTVIQGRTPVPFDVEILGVLPSGIAPGVDFILIKVSGPVIEQTGGIAFGMSGSPVYIEDKLAGAVAFGFFAADQTVGGMTPAEPMIDILDYPQAGGALETAAALASATEVRLRSGLRRVAAESAGVSMAEFPTTARHLPVPLAVSGLNTRAMRRLERLVERADLPVVPVRANASGLVGEVSAEPFEPGEAVAATLSTGDLTMAGVGTTTAVCGDLSVHFGHPFFFSGASSGKRAMGMNAADVVHVVPDPSNIFGPFKIANVAELRGSIDQDRLTGIRGVGGISPPVVPVVTDVRGPDLGKSRLGGQTDVITQELSFFGFTFHLLPFTAAFHLLLNLDVVFDRIGDGSVVLRFVVRGLGPSGDAFRLARPNIHVSGEDASFEGILEMLVYLQILATNPFGEVEFTDVRADGTITQERLIARIERVLSASTLRPVLRERSELRVRRGARIRLRVFLRSEEGELVREDLVVRAPRRAGPGALVVRGGRGDDFCFFCIFFDDEFGEDGEDGEGGIIGAGSFDDLLRMLRRAERNNDLVAEARVARSRRSARELQEFAVRGRRGLRLLVVTRR